MTRLASAVSVSMTRDRFRTLVARLGVFENDTAIEQKDFDFLGAVGEQQNVDVRMLAGRAVEDRTGEIGGVVGKQFQQAERGLAQREDQFRMPFFLIKTAIDAQLRLDLGIVRIGRVFGQTQLTGRLALGLVKIDNAVLRHQARRRGGDAGPGAGTGSWPFRTGHWANGSG